MTKAHPEDQFSEQEAQQRFEKLVRAALNTRPKPLKMMGPKGVPAQSKKRRAALPNAPEDQAKQRKGNQR
jgi:hypothetical protein